MAITFPRIGLAGLAWVAPGLLLMAALGCSGAAAFRIGYAGGLAFYLGALSWLLRIPVAFAPIVGWLALGAYLGLYPAVWVWLCWKIYPFKRTSPDDPSLHEPPGQKSTPHPGPLFVRGEGGDEQGQFFELLDGFLSTSWPTRLGWGFFCAALWVALDMIVGRLFTGFPWNYVGVSQYRMLPIIQIASVTGVYGVTFLLVWFSIALVSALMMLIRRPQTRWHSQRELLVPFVAAVAVAMTGWWHLVQPKPDQPTLTAALIQPSIPQTWIWDPSENSNRFQQLIQLSEKALTNHPDLLVWPEAAVPFMFRFDEDIFSAVTNLVITHKVWLVLGSDDGEVRVRPDGSMRTNYFNSSFLVNPAGQAISTYRKRRLVIFGEYIPFGREFAFIENLTGMGSFTPGSSPVNYLMPDLHAKAAILICFEDIFPHLTRTSVEDDTDFLLNLTNNGWFGESAAQWQHAANAVFRAVENGLPLVRSANNGLTCWVDAHGAMHDVYFPDTTDIYGVGFKLVHIPLLGGQKRPPTFYHRHGDWFGWGCAGLSALVIVLAIRKSTRFQNAIHHT